MPIILTTWDELSMRPARIIEVLSPISKSQRRLSVERTSGSGFSIWGTHDGSRAASSYRDWRFATSVPEIHGMYFEQWRTREKGSVYLEKAYLNIYRIIRNPYSEQELICLHCDPSEPDHSPHGRYKQGPHLHITAAEEPIPHAHFALNLLELNQILGSTDSLSNAIGYAVKMLKEEFLDALMK